MYRLVRWSACERGRWCTRESARERFSNLRCHRTASADPGISKMAALTLAFSLLLLVHVSSGEELPSSAHVCTGGSCYPATGNLLIGRAVNLTATSTCGLDGTENYCIVSHLQESDKCFQCTSQRGPDGAQSRTSHGVENVIYLKDRHGELTWWQSVNGLESVSLRLNLEAEFHFTHLIMKFKTFRPAAMLIERSSDFGRSWRPYRYFAYNCTKTFPAVPANGLLRINDVVCEDRYSDIEPSTEGEVIYKVLDPAIHVKDPYSLEIQELLRITNLRINLTKLHTLGDNLLDRRPDVLQKYYYALYELVVRGSCFCYGHASECAPVPGVDTREHGMIHGRCVCKHNTEGLNCERCRHFHNDLPWSPAESQNPHTCRECECNGHSSQCHFDMAVFLATGNVSGGVCDGCLHNTMGRSCDLCEPFYYRDPRRDVRDPQVCTVCDCDPVGSLEGGVCDGHSDLDAGMIAGQCRCKANVKGTRCDDCKEGYYGLSQEDPLGCQPCNCDPRGIIRVGAPCDQISGDCSCKRYVTGRHCDQCLAEYWGLSNDLAGCRSCDCDFGGAFTNRCMVENGQCDCRRHLIGRQCSEVQPGYFCAPLDFSKYEAEGSDVTGHAPDDSTLPGKARPQAEVDCVEHLNNQLQRHRRHRRMATAKQQRAALRRIRQLQQTPDVLEVHRVRSPGSHDHLDGPWLQAGQRWRRLVFTVDDVPHAMEYDIMIPLRTRGQRRPDAYVQMPRAFCFEPANRYTIAMRFQRHGVSHRHLTAFILVDSLVLIPKYMELPGFQGNGMEAKQRRQQMIDYMCVDSFMITPTPALAEMCSKLICSISAIIHGGALACQCDPQGSVSADCEKVGGQCLCKPNVIGRRCDQCAPGTYGFGQQGCSACDCHSQGADSSRCDPATGQCVCRPGATGRQCSDCQAGHWGFPACSPCQCNGHADACHAHTGECLRCQDHTDGHFCERYGVRGGYFGTPVLGSGERCRPCPCPGAPGSGHFHAHSCLADHASNHILCSCLPGYTGTSCDVCAPGYYGDPERPGGACRPCECSGNIDPLDPGSCDPRTGQCLRCLGNTDGPACSRCQQGYYGNALSQDCRRCTCVTAGTLESHCDGGVCRCDGVTGACPCREHVVGHSCDQCAPNHWNYGRGAGCEACGCQPTHALGPHCNMFTGQCQCRQGFGGRQCTECEELYWGDPQKHCKECNCDPQGSDTPQCDWQTGACACREGVSGQHCNSCSRGYTGVFPRCEPCHACFVQWDGELQKIKKHLEEIRHRVAEILKNGGPPGGSDERVRQLEAKLKQVQDLIGRGGADSDRVQELIGQRIDDLRAEVALTDGRLMGVVRDLNSTAVLDAGLRLTLEGLERDLSEVNATLNAKRQDVVDILPGGFTDQFEKVKQASRESTEAEQRCDASVSGPSSPVAQSRDTRERTQDLLDARKDSFLRSMAAQNKSLEQLQPKAHDLDKKIHHLSHKVCGGHRLGDADGHCPDSPCGGAGCRDADGERVCGGAGCNGTASSSVAALRLAKEAAASIDKASDDLQAVARKLQDIASLTQDVKNQAKTTLDKAQKKKAQFDRSNKELKDFIKKIKDFLTEEGADPESIEKVALQVLSITLPLNQTGLDRILGEIKESLTHLSAIQGVFNHSREDIALAKDLLERSKTAKERAVGVKDKVDLTKKALDVSQKAIGQAEGALREALENLNKTRNATATVRE
ncbi:LOW QUALITY PROTEIN: laminin subunit beta-2, partial [Gadus morhua]|uniref:LOW QUALITY PROTEIN: laminin subunit beta-2 n=1 Tax=Gadus morhua TaxID=8049 RepID=UPI0011B3CC11